MATFAAEPCHGLIAMWIVVPLLSGTVPEPLPPAGVELDTLLHAAASSVITASAAKDVFVRVRVTLPPLLDPSTCPSYLPVRPPRASGTNRRAIRSDDPSTVHSGGRRVGPSPV